MGTGCPFPGGKARLGRDADHSSHLVPRSRISRSDISSWRIRYKNELYQLFGEPAIIGEIKARRLKWLEHLFRTNEHHPVEC
jgi:hypothetical protein